MQVSFRKIPGPLSEQALEEAARAEGLSCTKEGDAQLAIWNDGPKAARNWIMHPSSNWALRRGPRRNWSEPAVTVAAVRQPNGVWHVAVLSSGFLKYATVCLVLLGLISFRIWVNVSTGRLQEVLHGQYVLEAIVEACIFAPFGLVALWAFRWGARALRDLRKCRRFVDAVSSRAPSSTPAQLWPSPDEGP